MKQISTLLLAAALPVCASATQLTPVTALNTKSAAKTAITALAPEALVTNTAATNAAATTITCTGSCVFEYYSDGGDWYYGASDDTQTYVVRLDYITNSEDKSTGTFNLSDLDTNYSFLTDNSTGSSVNYKYTEGTTFTVSLDGNILSITGTLVCSNGSTYNLVAKHDLAAGNQYDMSDQDVDVSFTTAETTVTTQEGYLVVDATNANNQYFSAVIIPNTNENGVGTYQINTSGAAGTAQAGDLDASTGYVYPTFYGTLDSEGYLNVPLFLCTTGTIELDFDDAGNIKLNVNATNTWGRTAKIKVNWSAGIEDITVDKTQGVRKVIENGRIVILKDGRKYNTLGLEVK